MIERTAMRDDNRRFPPSTGEDARPPEPAAGFRWDLESWGHVLRCEPLERVAQHLFTSRQPALPPGAPAGGPAGMEPWLAAASALGAAPSTVFRIRQVHGRAVHVVTGSPATAASADRPEADAVVSNVAGAVLAVVVADCVPVLLADAEAGAAGAVHAGWRGTSAGVVGAAVEALVRDCGARADRIVAAIGPSVGGDDYEVGDAVKAAFASAGHDQRWLRRWFHSRSPAGRPHLDLWQANRDQLEAAGVRPDAIHLAALSTVPHPAWFESFRRDGAAAGRMAALIRVPDAAAR